MRYFDEIRETTDNYTYNRLRIPYISACGYCGPGSRCCKTYKHKWYHVSIFNGKQKEVFPNWKMVSKNKKQWEKKPTWKKKFKYHHNKNSEGGYEIIWQGNNLR